MAGLDDLVYCLCVADSGTLAICGWIIEIQGSDIVLGTVPVPNIANSQKAKVVHAKLVL